MQLIKKLIVGTFLLSASLVQAQFVGGGSEENLRNAKPLSDKVWKNRFYLYGGPSMPIGAWGNEVEAEATLSNMYNNNAGFGAQRGWYAEMGNMFYLSKLAIPEQMGIAINWTYFQIMSNRVQPLALSTSASRLDVGNVVSFSMKLGATYSYSLFEGLVADAYFNLCPGFHIVPGMESYGSSNAYSYEYDVQTNSSFATRKNFGLQVRYKALTVGLDWMVGKYNLTKTIEIYDNRTRGYVLNETTISKFRTNSMQIRLGFTL